MPWCIKLRASRPWANPRSTHCDVQVHGIPNVDRNSGTVDWAPPETAAGKAVWTEVAVPDAKVGDSVTVSFSQPLPPGAILNGSMTGDGVVAVTLFNATATSLHPAPGIIRVNCQSH